MSPHNQTSLVERVFWSTGFSEVQMPSRTAGFFCLSVFLLIGLAALPAQGDDIVSVNVSNLVWVGNSTCGASGSPTCSETLNGSLQWDNTTNSMVAGSANFSATGDLGSVIFTGAGAGPFSPGETQLALFFDFTANIHDGFIAVDFDSPTPSFSAGTYPLNAVITRCNTTCLNEGFQDTAPESGSQFISSVPEPSSLVLLGTGALGLFGPIRRKLLPRWK